MFLTNPDLANILGDADVYFDDLLLCFFWGDTTFQIFRHIDKSPSQSKYVPFLSPCFAMTMLWIYDDSCILDGFLDSRWIPRFTMGS